MVELVIGLLLQLLGWCQGTLQLRLKVTNTLIRVSRDQVALISGGSDLSFTSDIQNASCAYLPLADQSRNQNGRPPNNTKGHRHPRCWCRWYADNFNSPIGPQKRAPIDIHPHFHDSEGIVGISRARKEARRVLDTEWESWRQLICEP